MSRPALEVADILRDHGAAWRRANAGHVSLGQMKVMSAIERCRTAALGGHVARCEDCAHTVIAYNSCLMGKFRNGELADDSIGLSVDLEIFALHYEMPLGRTLSLSRGQKGPLPGCRGTMASMASRRRHIQISVFWVSDPSEYLVSPEARSCNAAISRGPVVMESKRQIDQRRSTENAARMAVEPVASSPLRNLPIRQVMGDAH